MSLAPAVSSFLVKFVHKRGRGIGKNAENKIRIIN